MVEAAHQWSKRCFENQQGTFGGHCGTLPFVTDMCVVKNSITSIPKLEGLPSSWFQNASMLCCGSTPNITAPTDISLIRRPHERRRARVFHVALWRTRCRNINIYPCFMVALSHVSPTCGSTRKPAASQTPLPTVSFLYRLHTHMLGPSHKNASIPDAMCMD